ncbi:hypothetical protein [Actinoplanes xinjiangensis]|uniref:hypothetical protein n=1 Tax=Actinoplanes xinjiangensis TaxID=512350 RepID=UPI00342A9605
MREASERGVECRDVQPAVECLALDDPTYDTGRLLDRIRGSGAAQMVASGSMKEFVVVGTVVTMPPGICVTGVSALPRKVAKAILFGTRHRHAQRQV